MGSQGLVWGFGGLLGREVEGGGWLGGSIAWSGGPGDGLGASLRTFLILCNYIEFQNSK